jgi:hypothetical protein
MWAQMGLAFNTIRNFKNFMSIKWPDREPFRAKRIGRAISTFLPETDIKLLEAQTSAQSERRSEGVYL